MIDVRGLEATFRHDAPDDLLPEDRPPCPPRFTGSRSPVGGKGHGERGGRAGL
ncbi:hypothetical protein B005_1273 [Nocardiopsis alba ATCC BAA-2165]|uniref:Uncharacterized protein n=1 Tax=Nocardiopsis alba (strain ATCC BAA-2165 / BE74) TaxID=1205910 RepID=J7LK18_NOCAA|nr:hypothetical protein B005_1273 [Nocardiopsis alba ATCC BAA-2165]